MREGLNRETNYQASSHHVGTRARAGSCWKRETVELEVTAGSHSMLFLQGKAAVIQQTAEDLSSSSEQQQAGPSVPSASTAAPSRQGL